MTESQLKFFLKRRIVKSKQNQRAFIEEGISLLHLWGFVFNLSDISQHWGKDVHSLEREDERMERR
jgi:hypothetical protein